jgi:hypothetical protein
MKRQSAAGSSIFMRGSCSVFHKKNVLTPPEVGIMSPKRILRSIAPLTLGVLLLAGCMAPTPYVARLEGQQTGFTDRALAKNRYRVTFTGNSATPRETVESYLLLRAAEVARAAGYNQFIFDTRNTRAITSVQTVPTFEPVDPFWGPRGGYGYWGDYDYGFGYDPNVDIVVRTNFDSYAEIVLLTPEQAAKEPRALIASDVIAHLAPVAASASAAR